MRLCQHFLDHQRVDVNHAVLDQVQREHADFVILAAVAEALQIPLSVIMGEVSDRLAVLEGLQSGMTETVPDTVPAEFVEGYSSGLVSR